MLFKQRALQAIASGEVTLAFRRWRKPTVRTGGRLRTAVGELAIIRVEQVDADRITADEAHRAGFATLEALLAELGRRASGDPIYLVEVAPRGPDPRVELREEADLGAADVAALPERLDRLDRVRGPAQPWTAHTLRLIAELPGAPAGELAALAGQERTRFKARVRRLKELGLTESLSTGYRLSPRGAAFLDALLPS